MRAVDMTRRLGAVAAVLALCGCHDPAAHHDFVDPTIGDAIAANRAMQIVDPWPRGSFDRGSRTDGGRVEKTISDYRKGTDSAAASAGAPSTR